VDPEIAEPTVTAVHVDTSEAGPSIWWAWLDVDPDTGTLVDVEPWDLGIDAGGVPFVDVVAGPTASEDVNVTASGNSAGLVGVWVELA
jgi:hypothetical protein